MRIDSLAKWIEAVSNWQVMAATELATMWREVQAQGRAINRLTRIESDQNHDLQQAHARIVSLGDHVNNLSRRLDAIERGAEEEIS